MRRRRPRRRCLRGRWRSDSRAMPEGNFPSSGNIHQKSRLKPFHGHGAIRVAYTSVVHVRNPCRVSINVDIWLGDVPLDAGTRCMRLFDPGHDTGSVVPFAHVVHIEVRP
jgi:hypothetical protein